MDLMRLPAIWTSHEYLNHSVHEPADLLYDMLRHCSQQSHVLAAIDLENLAVVGRKLNVIVGFSPAASCVSHIYRVYWRAFVAMSVY